VTRRRSKVDSTRKWNRSALKFTQCRVQFVLGARKICDSIFSLFVRRFATIPPTGAAEFQFSNIVPVMELFKSFLMVLLRGEASYRFPLFLPQKRK
jgi:hypothetical protein